MVFHTHYGWVPESDSICRPPSSAASRSWLQIGGPLFFIGLNCACNELLTEEILERCSNQRCFHIALLGSAADLHKAVRGLDILQEPGRMNYLNLQLQHLGGSDGRMQRLLCQSFSQKGSHVETVARLDQAEVFQS